MKTILLALLSAFSLFSQQQQQTAKAGPATVNPSQAEPQAQSQDRPLTEIELTETLLAAKTVELEQKKIEESQRKIAEAQKKYGEIVNRACLSVGISADKIQHECGFTNGVGQNDQPIVGQDGRQIPAHVWKLPVQPTAGTGIQPTAGAGKP